MIQPKDFQSWLERASPGEKIVYHVGLLMKDRVVYIKPFASSQPMLAFTDAHYEGLEVWRAYLSGKVLLTQRKRDDGEYEYWAVKRAKSSARKPRSLGTGLTGYDPSREYPGRSLRSGRQNGSLNGGRAYVPGYLREGGTRSF